MKCSVCKKGTDDNYSVLPNSKIILCEKCVLGDKTWDEYNEDLKERSFETVLDILNNHKLDFILYQLDKKYPEIFEKFEEAIFFLENINSKIKNEVYEKQKQKIKRWGK